MSSKLAFYFLLGPLSIVATSGAGHLRDTNQSISSSSSKIVMEGWRASAASGFTTVGSTPDVHDCLEQCRLTWSSRNDSPRCRLVSYDLETRICTQFAKDAASANLAFSRNVDSVVAGYSDKQFEYFPKTHFCKMEKPEGGAVMTQLTGYTVRTTTDSIRWTVCTSFVL